MSLLLRYSFRKYFLFAHILLPAKLSLKLNVCVRLPDPLTTPGAADTKHPSHFS